MSKAISVLVVDDSPVSRMLLAHILEGAGITVVGPVASGQAALKSLSRTSPDVLLADIHMDEMDGFELARVVMETMPLPVVMCSAISDPKQMGIAFRAMEVGAVAVTAKPVGLGHPDYEAHARELVRTVQLMAEVRVVRRWPRERIKVAPTRTPEARILPAGRAVVAIGASTGGPPALQAILQGLPKDFSAPIVAVQHITPGFLPGLAAWLAQTTPLTVQLAANGLKAKAGHVYLAPDDYHLEIDRTTHLRLTKASPEKSLRPSVNHLFRSVAEHWGRSGIGVLLTGMGTDGAEGLLAMQQNGALTVAQDRASSVIFGMPGAALALGAVAETTPLDGIAGLICHHLSVMDANGKEWDGHERVG